MNVFQALGLTFVFGVTVLTVALARRRALGKPAAGVWMALWILAATLILRPQLTKTVANLLGIDRGADLVFYCAILAMLLGFLIVFARLRRLSHQLTELTRTIAVHGALPPTDAPAAPPEDRP